MKFKQIINSFSAWTVDRLTSARRATLTMLATFLIAMTAQTAWASTFSGGNGSSGNPYQISSIADLNQLATDVNSGTNYAGEYFLLTTDLNYGGTTNNFTPIGKQTSGSDPTVYPFKGYFDGGGHTISGIRISASGNTNDACYKALFGLIQSAEIKNVKLSNTQISGYCYVGGIVGASNNYSKITNCYVANDVTISGDSYCGGIAGENLDNCTISGCSSKAPVSGEKYIGGIAGYNQYTIEECFVPNANVTATLNARGAIAGAASSSVTPYFNMNYYTSTIEGLGGVGDYNGGSGTSQDRDGACKAYTISLSNGMTVTWKEDTPSSYNYSGITSYGFTNLEDCKMHSVLLYTDPSTSTSTYYAGANTSANFQYNYDGYQVSVKDADQAKVDYTKTINETANAVYHNYKFTMPAKAVTITATDVWDAAHKNGSTEANAYVITSTAGLDLLAQNVNAGRVYINMYFKLGANITYTHTTDWNDATSTENNFTPIGVDSNTGKNFGGFFDGCNYTISGIRIHSDDDFQGIFAWPQSDTAKEIKNIKLANARIVGNNNVGGIVGKFDRTITNCHIASTVAIIATNYNCGGIAGYDGGPYSSIIGCTSAATVSGNNYVGGIAGGIVGSITDCFVTGATVSGTAYVGAIVGFKNTDGTLKNNYYYNSTVTIGGTAATDAGCNGADVAGARKAYTVTLDTDVLMDGTCTAHGSTPNAGDISIKSFADNSGILYTINGSGSTTYAGATETIKLKYTGTVAEGCVVGYSVNDGEATAGNTITMPAADATITEVDMALWGNGDGDSEATAYVITTTEGLDLLAQKVNGGSEYRNKFFKLGDNIAYDKNTPNNYTPIGKLDKGFYGSFDGQGHTISGIKINNPDADFQGVFGFLYGTVKNLVVSSCSIEGRHDVGAIAGKLKNGTIENCSASDVILSGNGYVGGIVGASEKGTIIGCVSAATITGIKISNNNAYDLGGIAGATTTATDPSSLTDNLFTGAITGYLQEYIGAIVGINANGTLTNNLYTFTGLGGVGIASGSEQSTTGADGAGAHKAVEIIAAEGVTITPTGTKTTYNVSGITAYTDNNFIGYDSKLYAGATQAATFSIDYTEPEGYMFEGFDAGEGVGIVLNEGVYNLAVPASGNVTISAKLKDLTLTLDKIVEFETLAIDPTMQSYVENGALKLKVTPKNKFWTLACGVDLLLPEGIVVYKARMNSAGTKVDLTEISDSELNGVLKANNGVLIASTPGESYEFKVSPENSVTALSTADAKSYGNDNQLVPVLEETHFDSENYFILTDNQFVMVDVSKDTKVPVGKAVLKVPAGTAQARAFGIDGYDTTGINAALENAGEEVWYNLQGQRISKPTRKGIYILNGKKVRM